MRSLSISASGLKAEAKSKLDSQCSGETAVASALKSLVDAMSGTRVSISGSLNDNTISLSASAWTDANDTIPQ